MLRENIKILIGKIKMVIVNIKMLRGNIKMLRGNIKKYVAQTISYINLDLKSSYFKIYYLRFWPVALGERLSFTKLFMG